MPTAAREPAPDIGAALAAGPEGRHAVEAGGLGAGAGSCDGGGFG